MATQLIDVTELRARFDIHPSVKPERLQPCIRAASRRLRQWVGASLYTTVLAQNLPDKSSLTPDEVDRVTDLQDAEGYLAMHFAILGLSTQVRAQGLIEEEKLSEGGTIIRLMNFQRTQDVIAEYLRQAEEMARPYLATTVESSFEFADIAEDCDG